MRKYFILFLVIITFSSCFMQNSYTNKDFRYKVKYPSGWVAIPTGKNRTLERDMKERLQRESPYIDYDTVDVAFYNPDSEGPIFEEISISSVKNIIKIQNVNLSDLETMMQIELLRIFETVTPYSPETIDLKNGKALRFIFHATYNKEKYYIVYLVLPGLMYGTHFIKLVTPLDKAMAAEKELNAVVSSFHKY